jgi:hypothetical protein
MERATPSPDLLVADDSLHNFDKTTDLRESLRVPILCDAGSSERLLPAQVRLLKQLSL